MKVSELRELTEEELDQRFTETRKELFNLRVQRAARRLEKPSRVRELRRDVAKINTIMNERAKAAR